MNHKIFADLINELKNGKTTDLAFPVEDGSVIRRWIPKERLILLGGGHIALPLCRIGAMLDFSVVVVDDPAVFCQSSAFPGGGYGDLRRFWGEY